MHMCWSYMLKLKETCWICNKSLSGVKIFNEPHVGSHRKQTFQLFNLCIKKILYQTPAAQMYKYVSNSLLIQVVWNFMLIILKQSSFCKSSFLMDTCQTQLATVWFYVCEPAQQPVTEFRLIDKRGSMSVILNTAYRGIPAICLIAGQY